MPGSRRAETPEAQRSAAALQQRPALDASSRAPARTKAQGRRTARRQDPRLQSPARVPGRPHLVQILPDALPQSLQVHGCGAGPGALAASRCPPGGAVPAPGARADPTGPRAEHGNFRSRLAPPRKPCANASLLAPETGVAPWVPRCSLSLSVARALSDCYVVFCIVQFLQEF